MSDMNKDQMIDEIIAMVQHIESAVSPTNAAPQSPCYSEGSQQATARKASATPARNAGEDHVDAEYRVPTQTAGAAPAPTPTPETDALSDKVDIEQWHGHRSALHLEFSALCRKLERERNAEMCRFDTLFEKYQEQVGRREVADEALTQSKRLYEMTLANEVRWVQRAEKAEAERDAKDRQHTACYDKWQKAEAALAALQKRLDDTAALDLRNYGFADLDPKSTQKWLDSIGGILGETFAHFVKTNPTGVVREIGGLLITKETALAEEKKRLDSAGEGLPPEALILIGTVTDGTLSMTGEVVSKHAYDALRSAAVAAIAKRDDALAVSTNAAPQRSPDTTSGSGTPQEDVSAGAAPAQTETPTPERDAFMILTGIMHRELLDTGLVTACVWNKEFAPAMSQLRAHIEKYKRERDAARAELGCAPNCNRGEYLRGRLAELQKRLDASESAFTVIQSQYNEANVERMSLRKRLDDAGAELPNVLKGAQRDLQEIYVTGDSYEELSDAAAAAIEKRDAEIARLRSSIQDQFGTIKALSHGYDTSSEAIVGIAKLREDAARMDWLEQHDGRFFNIDKITSVVGKGFNGNASLRYAIDLACQFSTIADAVRKAKQ